MKPTSTTAVTTVLEILQDLKKLDVAKELSYQLDQSLPNALSNTQTEMRLMYECHGLKPSDSSTATTPGWVDYPALCHAKNSLFKQQEHELRQRLLIILGFPKIGSNEQVY